MELKGLSPNRVSGKSFKIQKQQGMIAFRRARSDAPYRSGYRAIQKLLQRRMRPLLEVPCEKGLFR
jgi:hypothetical protein